MPINDLLKFPCRSYLMIRLDYVLISEDELEAKILRIIEMYMDIERMIIYRDLLNAPGSKVDPNAVTEVTKDVWPAISYRLFKNDLYDHDMSDNTLKRAIRSLKKKQFIAIDDSREKRYEAPKYQILVENVQKEFDLITRLGKAGYQKLMVSKIDTIKTEYHQILTPSEGQNLIPSTDSRVSNFDGNSRISDSVDSLVKEYTGCASAQQPTPPFLEPFEPTDPIPGEVEEILRIAVGTTTTAPFPVIPETPLPTGTFRRSSAQPSVPVVPHGRAPHSLRLVPSSGQVVQDSLLPPAGDVDPEPNGDSRNGYRKSDAGNSGNGEQANDVAAPEQVNGGRARKRQVSVAEINEFVKLFDKLGRETTYENAFGETCTVMPQGYGHTGVDRDHIKALLRNNLREETPDFVNPAKLTRVYQHMASLPPEDGFQWAAQGMSIKSVCNNYSRFANDLIQAARRKQQQQQTPPSAPPKKLGRYRVATPDVGAPLPIMPGVKAQ